MTRTLLHYLLRLSLGGLILFSGLEAHAQQSFGGQPLFIGQNSLRSVTDVKQVVPNFNPADLLQRDDWQGQLRTKPYDIGKVVDYDVNFAEEADLVATLDGTNVYRLTLQLDGSPVGINLYYKDFYIPKGGKLYIYTLEGHNLLGAYTHETHPEHGAFATEPLPGNSLVLDYEAPIGVDMPSIQISGVGFLFRPFFASRANLKAAEFLFPRYEDGSDPGYNKFCQVNVNCEEGDMWEDQKSSSVAYIMVFQDGTQSCCSGNVLNNAREDFTPYVITAAHCSGEDVSRKNPGFIDPTIGEFNGSFGVDQEKMDQWIFCFNYEKPRCSDGDYAIESAKTLTGATMRSYLSHYGYSDGFLLELKDKIPLDYRVYYSGWDATEKDSWPQGVGIHHPAGDATKISVFNKGMFITTWESSENQAGANDHYQFRFQKGNTEGGSSGSPLFNDKGLQVGTLTGGATGICVMDAYYGRLSSHFDKYTKVSDQHHMDIWLDPDHKGIRQMSGAWNENYRPFEVVKELKGKINSKDISKVDLSWTPVPVHAQGYGIKYNLYRDDQLIATQTETTYTDQVDKTHLAPGQIKYAVEAVYDVNGQPVATSRARRSVYTGRLVMEVEASVSENTSGGTQLLWSAPLNAQIVTKIDDRKKMSLEKAEYSKKVEGGIQSLYLQDIYRLGGSPLDGQKLYVHQLNILPAFDTPVDDNGKYQRNEAARYVLRQKVNRKVPLTGVILVPQGTTEKQEWVSVLLDRPFEIDDRYNLEVGFEYNRMYRQHYPIYVDKNSKDNHFSADGGLIKIKFNAGGFLAARTEVIPYEEDYNYTEAGYQAVEMVISDRATKGDKIIDYAFTRGPLPVPFPTVANYVVYRNGTEIATLPADVTSYADDKGKVSDVYTIAVRYDYPDALGVNVSEVEKVDRPALYPTIVTQTASLSHAAEVESLQIFDVTGASVFVANGTTLQDTFDLSTLSAGTYLVVIQTAHDSYTQKIVKE